jgi:hypothetical protein
MSDYVLLGIVAAVLIGGGIYLIGEARQYRRRHSDDHRR